MGNRERGKTAESGLSRHTDDGGAGAPLENISSLFLGIRKTRQPMHYDVIIIGGGPGGTTAAKELAAGGKKVAIIEDKHWGARA